MDVLALIISLLIGLLSGFYLGRTPDKESDRVQVNKEVEKERQIRNQTQNQTQVDCQDPDGTIWNKQTRNDSNGSVEGNASAKKPANWLDSGIRTSEKTDTSMGTRPGQWSSSSYTSSPSLDSPLEVYADEAAVRNNIIDNGKGNVEGALTVMNQVGQAVITEMFLSKAVNVPPPMPSHASPVGGPIESTKSVEMIPLLRETSERLVVPPHRFEVSASSRRKKLVIVSLNLPINAFRNESGAWTVEWDQPRSDHMTPNLKMLTETMDVTWVGWPGVFVPKAEEDDFSELLEKFNCRPVFITQDLKLLFFDKCCKEILWPLLHYRMPASNVSFAKDWDLVWQGYTTANMLYSKQVSAFLENYNEMVWIHNYHLCLVPSFLRKKYPRAKVGFFLHTPFPTSDVFRCLPGRANILRGILCADLVGFHTYDYARHFLSSVKRVLDLEVETLPGGSLGITTNGRAVTIRISHVGIHSSIYSSTALLTSVEQRRNEIKAKYAGRTIILGFDEYDLVKGTILKFHAYEQFLAAHPEFRKSVVLLEIILGSFNAADEKLKLRAQVMEQVKLIQEKYGEEVLQLIEPPAGKMTLELNELVAYYGAAAVGLFTTFWDGLNIIPYEFTASQTESNPGALIVSEFMGCSRSLSGVLRVNPWKLDEVSDSIATALSMEETERKANHRRRYNYVMNHTLESWAYGFLSELEKSAQYCDELNLVQVGWGSNVSLIGLRKNFHHLNLEDVNMNFRHSHRRVLILDYDGTLTSETDRYLCRPSETLLKNLQTLCNDSRNVVFIISGRERKVLVDWFSSVKNLGLAPEKGCYIRWPGTEQWLMTHGVNARDWKDIALNLIQQYTDRTDGSYIEDKESAIVWHFEGADPEYGRMQASELAKFLQGVLSLHQVDVVKYDYNRILEVKPKGINKGMTTKAILHRLAKEVRDEIQQGLVKNPFFVLCVGDDRSDEDMFLALSASSPILQELTITRLGLESSSESIIIAPIVYTCCVGLKPSNASHYLHDPQEVLGVIEALTNSQHDSSDFALPIGLERRASQMDTSRPSALGGKIMRSGKGGVSNLAALGRMGN